MPNNINPSNDGMPRSGFNPEERHYSVQELAAALNVSEDKIRRDFGDEPDVIDLGNPSSGKRPYRPLRIPQHVVDRFYERKRIRGSR